MANALPQAIGAQTAYPDRQVISMPGDGGLSMPMGELLTVKRQHLPVKIVVFNNSSLGMVKPETLVTASPTTAPITNHQLREHRHRRRHPVIAVEDPQRVHEPLQKAFAEPGPALVEVITDPNALSLPPKLNIEQITGFAPARSCSVAVSAG